MLDDSKFLRYSGHRASVCVHNTVSSIRTAAFAISLAGVAVVALLLWFTSAGFENNRHIKLRTLNGTPKPVICTYFEPLGLNEENDNKTREMLDIWRESWANNGWGTRVLTSKDATLHPRHSTILETLLKLPTVNAQAYEMACYLRWVAAVATGCTVRVSAPSIQPTPSNTTDPTLPAVDVRCRHGQLRLSSPEPLDGRQAL
jgi:hypothetical protein